MDKNKTILVCPLEWGLGHATRCIPLIQQFLDEGHRVIIASSGKPEALLKKEFPQLQFIPLKGYDIEYSEKGSMITKMLLQLPKIKKAIEDEHLWLDQIIDKYSIDMVVSDNRYGLWTKKVESVLMTHQLFIKAPTGEWLLEKIVKKYLNNFDEVWIPDVEDEDNLSGELSHKKTLPLNYRFIGILSRFSTYLQTQNIETEEYDFIAILSGPEPQRTIFENIILKQLENTDFKGILVRGLPEEKLELKIENSELKVFNHLEIEEFLKCIQKSKVVICRSGYSSLMDLTVLSKKAILVPTPGQTEQEYLAQYLSKKGNFITQKQSEFDLEKGLNELKLLN
ncbi:MAG: glycosyl transferase family 28 [Flavobacteriales bacterium]|nr:glycosyl transferase family 28 [Flavobacteriales bacterium]